MTRSVLDTALDLSVIGGYTKFGYRIRSGRWNALPGTEGTRETEQDRRRLWAECVALSGWRDEVPKANSLIRS